MKAVLALVVIYLAMFLVAIQGGSSAPVQAAAQNTTKQSNTSQIDPAKDADIRALIELVGARDQIQDSITLPRPSSTGKSFWPPCRITIRGRPSSTP